MISMLDVSSQCRLVNVITVLTSLLQLLCFSVHGHGKETPEKEDPAKIPTITRDFIK